MSGCKRPILVVLLFSSLSVRAAEPVFANSVVADESGIMWLHEYDAGIKTALRDRKPIFISFGAVWCRWCRRMEEEVFTNPSVAARLKAFTCIEVDLNENPDVAIAYGVMSLPRMIVINTHDEIVGDWLGYRDPDEFVKLLVDIEPYTTVETGTAKRPKVLSLTGPLDSITSSQLIEPNDVDAVMNLLGNKDAAVRQRAIDILTSAGRSAVPLLLRALEHDYLGVRITAYKALHTLDRDIEFDPWASRQERGRMLQVIVDRQRLDTSLPKTNVPTASTN